MNKQNNKKFKKAIRGLIRVLIIGAGVGIYFGVSALGDRLRGYDGTGGEILILVIPFLIVVAEQCIDELIDLLK